MGASGLRRGDDRDFEAHVLAVFHEVNGAAIRQAVPFVSDDEYRMPGAGDDRGMDVTPEPRADVEHQRIAELRDAIDGLDLRRMAVNRVVGKQLLEVLRHPPIAEHIDRERRIRRQNSRPCERVHGIGCPPVQPLAARTVDRAHGRPRCQGPASPS